jgi:hypothetical protein
LGEIHVDEVIKFGRLDQTAFAAETIERSLKRL